VWFCRVLLLFKIKAQTDSGLKEFECAYVSVLERYTVIHKPPLHQFSFHQNTSRARVKVSATMKWREYARERKGDKERGERDEYEMKPHATRRGRSRARADGRKLKPQATEKNARVRDENKQRSQEY